MGRNVVPNISSKGHDKKTSLHFLGKPTEKLGLYPAKLSIKVILQFDRDRGQTLTTMLKEFPKTHTIWKIPSH